MMETRGDLLHKWPGVRAVQHEELLTFEITGRGEAIALGQVWGWVGEEVKALANSRMLDVQARPLFHVFKPTVLDDGLVMALRYHRFGERTLVAYVGASNMLCWCVVEREKAVQVQPQGLDPYFTKEWDANLLWSKVNALWQLYRFELEERPLALRCFERMPSFTLKVAGRRDRHFHQISVAPLETVAQIGVRLEPRFGLGVLHLYGRILRPLRPDDLLAEYGMGEGDRFWFGQEQPEPAGLGSYLFVDLFKPKEIVVLESPLQALVVPGLNIEGVCRHPGCQGERRVWVGHGYGRVGLEEVLCTTPCQTCEQPLEVVNLGLHHCRYMIRARSVAEDAPPPKWHQVPPAYLRTFDPNQQKEWQWAELVVQALPPLRRRRAEGGKGRKRQRGEGDG